MFGVPCRLRSQCDTDGRNAPYVGVCAIYGVLRVWQGALLQIISGRSRTVYILIQKLS